MVSVQEGKNFIHIQGNFVKCTPWFLVVISRLVVTGMVAFVILATLMNTFNITQNGEASFNLSLVISISSLTIIALYLILKDYLANSCRIDLTKETFHWRQNYGTYDKTLYFKEIREIAVVHNIVTIEMKNSTHTETYYQVEALDDRGRSHPIANFRNRDRAFDTAEKIGELTGKTTKEKII